MMLFVEGAMQIHYKLDGVSMPSRAEAFELQKLTCGIITIHWEQRIWYESRDIPLPGRDSLMELGMESIDESMS